jgi:hypothetical protein
LVGLSFNNGTSVEEELNGTSVKEELNGTSVKEELNGTSVKKSARDSLSDHHRQFVSRLMSFNKG